MPTPTVVSPDTIPSLSHAFSAVGCNSIHSYEQGGLQSDCNPFSDLDVGTGRWVILLHASGLNEILDIDVKKFVEFLLSVSFILTTSYSMTEMFWSAEKFEASICFCPITFCIHYVASFMYLRKVEGKNTEAYWYSSSHAY